MTRNQIFRATVGDLARPFSIYASSLSASIATVLIAWYARDGKVELLAAAAYITAVWAGVGALYWGKVWERKEEAKQGAQVEIARAATASPTSPGSTDVNTSSMSVNVQRGDAPAPDGELPPSQRVRP